MDVVDFETLQKKYLNKKVPVIRGKEGVLAEFNCKTKELFLKFSYQVSSSEEYTYDISIYTDDNLVIQKIIPLQCELFCCDNARGSTYQNKQPDPHDYYRLDCLLEELFSEV